MNEKSSHAGTACTHYTHAVLEYVESQGHRAEDVFGAQWVRQLRASPPHHRVSVHQWQTTLQRAVSHLNDPVFPIKLAHSIKSRHLGLLGFLVMSCDTLGQAALTLQRYEQLLDSVNEAQWDVVGDQCFMSWNPLIPNPPAEVILLSMAQWVIQARWLSERADISCDMHLTQTAPADPAVRLAFERELHCRVHFDRPRNQLVFPLHYASLPIAQRDPQVHAVLRAQAETDLAALLGQHHSFLAHLEAELIQRMETGAGEITLQEMAQTMSLAPRTLQHRLDEYGLTYRQLLDKVRCRLAERHLRDPRLSLAEVAMMLGYADQSGFHHAFKRWKGASPGEYRRRLMPA
ncbi:AraC family transcriptional regulator [Aquabacterium sp.]|uniref:AraC family transcriptional regulator n=1 Tax=Aquabacterium sp. TaxID=1872578 RepID=UPI0025C193DA|nr:AraC family transcriptional regulator [Aquabacterium sp.]